LTELFNASKPNILIRVVLMGDDQINLYARIEKCLEAVDANIVISKDDCVQLFFL
jgi:hypothetical protein